MKIYHQPELDYVSIDFRDEIEAKSVFENGIIVRLDRCGHVIGLDITDSSQFFAGSEWLSLQDACRLLGISESTMRRRIRRGEVAFSKGADRRYHFRKNDLLKLAS